MPTPTPREILEEIAVRERAKASTAGLVDGILSELFDEQRAFVEDPSKRKAALCTRRAGKTQIWTRLCATECRKHPRILIRIWAINRLRAKQLLWEEFKYLFRRHKMDFELEHMHETELTIKFENGSEIRLLGADKDKEAQKKRGDKTWLEIILETQGYGGYLRRLLDDVVEPCTFDQQGTICLEGTPGPLPTGYWYNVTGDGPPTGRWTSTGMRVQQADGNFEENVGAGWSCHHWSLVDNPFMDQWKGKKNWRQLAKWSLDVIRQKKGWTESNPTYQREYLGRWVRDDSALYYRFDSKRNVYDASKIVPWGPGWFHVLGWDLGSKDDMALVAWAWNDLDPHVYEAFSWKKPGALAQDVMDQIATLERRGFNFIAKVADTGGGGRMYVEEVMSRYAQVFEPAKKSEKYEHVRLYNEDLLVGRMLLCPGSPLAQEIAQLPKDPDWPDPEKPEKPPTEDPRFPNHCADASLYAHRRAYHFLHTEKRALSAGEKQDAALAALEKKLAEQTHPWWEPQDEEAFDDPYG